VPSVDIYDSWELVTRHMPIEQPPATASYIIFKKGTKTYAKNGETGHIEFEGSDDAKLIQQAIDNIPEGGTIYIRNGTYYIGSKLTIDKRIRLCGEHMDKTKLYLKDNVNDDMIYIENTTTTEYFQTIENMYLYGNSDNNTAGHAINQEAGSSDIQIRNMFITHFPYYGIRLNTAWGAVVHRCCIEHCGYHAIWINGSETYVSHCMLAECGYYGLHYYDGKPATIIGNVFWYNQKHGLYLNTPEKLVVVGNAFRGNGYSSSDTYDAIHIVNANDITIEGNSIWADHEGTNVTRYGVYIEAGNNIRIGGANRIVGCLSGEVYDGGTNTVINGYGREAAGAGNPPTAANWQIGDIVQNTDDNTFWIKCYDGTMRQIA